MKLIFLGSGAFGLPTLASLHQHHQVLAVVSQPDKPAGRKRVLTATPIGQWAIAQQLNVIKSADVNTPEMIAKMQQYQADAAVVIAFGQKLSEELIASLGKQTVNLHASLLPRYRGAAPIHHAIIDGQSQTGVSVIALAQKMDAGEVFATLSTPIDPNETAGELHDRLAQLGPAAIEKVLQDIARNSLVGQLQDHPLATLAPKLCKADGHIRWDQPATTVRNQIHGLTPWPGAMTHWCRPEGHQNKKQAKLLLIRRVQALETMDIGDHLPGTILDNGLVATGQGAIGLLQLQLPGKKSMTLQAFNLGHRLEPGDQFQTVAGTGP